MFWSMEEIASLSIEGQVRACPAACRPIEGRELVRRSHRAMSEQPTEGLLS